MVLRLAYESVYKRGYWHLALLHCFLAEGISWCLYKFSRSLAKWRVASRCIDVGCLDIIHGSNAIWCWIVGLGWKEIHDVDVYIQVEVIAGVVGFIRLSWSKVEDGFCTNTCTVSPTPKPKRWAISSTVVFGLLGTYSNSQLQTIFHVEDIAYWYTAFSRSALLFRI